MMCNVGEGAIIKRKPASRKVDFDCGEHVIRDCGGCRCQNSCPWEDESYVWESFGSHEADIQGVVGNNYWAKGWMILNGYSGYLGPSWFWSHTPGLAIYVGHPAPKASSPVMSKGILLSWLGFCPGQFHPHPQEVHETHGWCVPYFISF